MVLGKFPPGEIPPEKFSLIKLPPSWKIAGPPGKLPPRKLPSGILPPILLIVFLHLKLRFDKFSQT